MLIRVDLLCLGAAPEFTTGLLQLKRKHGLLIASMCILKIFILFITTIASVLFRPLAPHPKHTITVQDNELEKQRNGHYSNYVYQEGRRHGFHY